jgi:hypothetical protein
LSIQAVQHHARYNATTGYPVLVRSLRLRTPILERVEKTIGKTYRLGTSLQEYNPPLVRQWGCNITTNGTTVIAAALSDAAGWTPPTSTIGDLVFDDNSTNGGVFDAGSGYRRSPFS